MCLSRVLSLLFFSLLTGHVISKIYDVVIVGAGYAGMGAAKQFHENNKSFIVLEGKNYIGGRVQNVIWDGLSIPLGAGWIHSPDDNHTVVKLAKQYKLKFYKDSYAISNLVVRYGYNGTWIPEYKVNLCKKLYLKKFEEVNKLMEERAERGDCRDPDVLSALEMVNLKADTPLKNAMEYFMLNFENGVEPQYMGARTYGHTLDVNEWIVKDDRGYVYPLIQDSQSFLDKVQLGKTVTHIEKSYSNGIYKVKCQDGSYFWTRKVLVTVSSGVLQSNNIKFSPPLPHWKTRVFHMFPMAHYCKVFLKFPNYFWDNRRGYMLLATDSKGEFVHWQNFNRYRLFPGSKVLQTLLTGEKCKESYKQSDEEILERAYKVLKRVFPYASRPTAILRNNFTIDPLFQGSYSYQKPGINVNHYRAFSHPVHQSLFFAGEAYALIDYGYTHSAYGNGVMVAKQMLKCIENRKECPKDRPEFVDKITC